MVERIIVGPLHTNTYIVSTAKKQCIVVDPGGDIDHILQRLEALNMKPVAVVMTHGHLDHTAMASRIRDKYQGIPIGIHKADKALLHGSSRDEHLATFQALTADATQAVDTLYDDSLPKPDFFLKDGQQLLDSDLSVIHTPGHTPGSVCFYSEEREALFSGDTLLFTTVGSSEGRDSNTRDLLASITEKLFRLPEQTRLFPGHGPLSNLEREMRNNIGLREKRTV